MEKHKDAHDRLVIAMLALVILCLIYIGIQLTPMHERGEKMDRRIYQPMQNIQVSDGQTTPATSTYMKHGFSIEVPAGYVPREEATEGGPATSIMFPKGVMLYISDAKWWDAYNMENIKYVKDQKIGTTTFKVYQQQSELEVLPPLYVFKQGNVEYQYNGDITQLETFKFIGFN